MNKRKFVQGAGTGLVAILALTIIFAFTSNLINPIIRNFATDLGLNDALQSIVNLDSIKNADAAAWGGGTHPGSYPISDANDGGRNAKGLAAATAITSYTYNTQANIDKMGVYMTSGAAGDIKTNANTIGIDQGLSNGTFYGMLWGAIPLSGDLLTMAKNGYLSASFDCLFAGGNPDFCKYEIFLYSTSLNVTPNTAYAESAFASKIITNNSIFKLVTCPKDGSVGLADSEYTAGSIGATAVSPEAKSLIFGIMVKKTNANVFVQRHMDVFLRSPKITFTSRYKNNVTAKFSATSGGNVSATSTLLAAYNSTASSTATANDGYYFNGWTGTASAKSRTITTAKALNFTANPTYTANFAAITTNGNYGSDAYVYNNSPQAPKANAISGYTVTNYYGTSATSQTSTVVPTNAGEYWHRAEVKYGSEVVGGKSAAAFTISQKNVSTGIDIGDISIFYSGTELTPTPTVNYAGYETLINGTDFDFSYFNNIFVTTATSKATLTITGKGNYFGTYTINFEIDKALVSLSGLYADALNYGQLLSLSSITGSALNSAYPSVAVPGYFTFVQGETMPTVADSGVTQYEVSFTLTGGDKDNYEQPANMIITLVINPKALGGNGVVSFGAIADAIYTSFAKEPTTDIKDLALNFGLTENIDFTYSYSQNTDVGTATLTINGIGNYAGTASTTFNITKATVNISAQDITLTYGDSLAHSNIIGTATNNNAASVAVSGNWIFVANISDCPAVSDSGSYSVRFQIADINNYEQPQDIQIILTVNKKSLVGNVSFAAIENMIYSGGGLTPNFVTTDNTLGELFKDTDYTYFYSDNIAAGIATITITGINNYDGSASTTFTIEKANIVLTPQNISLQYGDTLVDAMISGTATNSAHGVSVAGVWYFSQAIADIVPVIGTNVTVKVNYKDFDNNNYNAPTEVELTLTFTVKYLTVSGIAAETRAYNKEYGVVTSGGTLVGKVGNDEVFFTLGSNAASVNNGVGTHSVTNLGITLYGANSNLYDIIQPTDVTVTITAKTVEVVFEDFGDKTYNTAMQGISAHFADINELYDDVDIILQYKFASGESNVVPQAAGRYIATVTLGNSNYTISNKNTQEFSILPKNVSEGLIIIINNGDPYTYTGSQIMPQAGDIIISYLGETLTIGKDFSINAYGDNLNVGDINISITIWGNGNYSNGVTKTFAITPKVLTTDNISVEGIIAAQYDKTPHQPQPYVKDTAQNVNLAVGNGYDFYYTYQNNINAGEDSATVTINGVNNYTGTVSVNFSILKRIVSVVFSGYNNLIYNGGAHSLSGTLQNTISGDLTVPTLVITNNKDAINAGSYIATASLDFAAISERNYVIDESSTAAFQHEFTIGVADVIIGGIIATDRQYDASNITVALSHNNITYDRIFAQDDVRVKLSSIAEGTIISDVVGNYSVTLTIELEGADSANYRAVQSEVLVDITERELTISDVSAIDRDYNATTVVGLSGGVLQNVSAADSAYIGFILGTGTVSSKNASSSAYAVATDIKLTGEKADNYILIQPDYVNVKISVVDIIIEGISATDRQYDAADTTVDLYWVILTYNKIFGMDYVTVNTNSIRTGTIASAEVGAYEVLLAIELEGADSANYRAVQSQIQVNIGQKDITIADIQAENRAYNATNIVRLSGGMLEDVCALDSPYISFDLGDGTVASKNASERAYYVTTNITLIGEKSHNYRLVQPSYVTAEISVVDVIIEGLSANSRQYNANDMSVSLHYSQLTYNQIFASDDVSVATESIQTGRISNDSVGNYNVLVTITLQGADSANYRAIQQQITVEITQRELTIKDVEATNREYDGTTIVTLRGGYLQSVCASDIGAVGFSLGSGTIASKNAAINAYAVSTNIQLVGEKADNYVLTQPNYITAEISIADIVISGISAVDRQYHAGNTTVSLAYDNISYNKIFATDNVYVNADSVLNGTIISDIVGTYFVTINIELDGADSANYNAVQGSISVAISPKEVTVDGVSAANREYDGTNIVELQGGILNGVYAADMQQVGIDLSYGTITDKNSALAPRAVFTNITLTGAMSGNYILTAQPQNVMVLIQPRIISGATLAAKDREYIKGDTAVEITVSNPLNILENETITITVLGNMLSADVGNKKIVNIDKNSYAIIANEFSANYVLDMSENSEFAKTTTVSIAPHKVTISGITAISRGVSESNEVVLDTSAASIIGIFDGDTANILAGAVGYLANAIYDKDIKETIAKIVGANIALDNTNYIVDFDSFGYEIFVVIFGDITVIFDFNGGTVNQSPNAYLRIPYQTAINTAEVYTDVYKRGYTQNNIWYIDTVSGDVFDFGTLVNADITLICGFDANSYNAYYNENGTDVLLGAFTYDQPYKLGVIFKNNYIFTSWNIGSEIYTTASGEALGDWHFDSNTTFEASFSAMIITPPADAEVSGADIALQYGNATAFTSANKDGFSLSYYYNNNETQAPINVGTHTYNVVYTLNEDSTIQHTGSFGYKINKRVLTINKINNTFNKVYDGTANFTDSLVYGVDYTFNNKLEADTIILAYTAAYNSKKVLEATSILVECFELNGADCDNYEFVPTTIGYAATISPFNTPNIFKAYSEYEYSGEALVINAAAQGVVGEDIKVTISYNQSPIAIGEYVATASLNDANYILGGDLTHKFSIVRKGLILQVSNVMKRYDGTANAVVNDYNLEGICADDEVYPINMVASYNQSMAGSHIPLTIKYQLAGADVDNYYIIESSYYGSIHPTEIIDAEKPNSDIIIKIEEGYADADAAVKIETLGGESQFSEILAAINAATSQRNGKILLSINITLKDNSETQKKYMILTSDVTLTSDTKLYGYVNGVYKQFSFDVDGEYIVVTTAENVQNLTLYQGGKISLNIVGIIACIIGAMLLLSIVFGSTQKR